MDSEFSLAEMAKRADKSLAEVAEILENIRQGMKPLERTIHVRENDNDVAYHVVRRGIGPILRDIAGSATLFWMFTFSIDDAWGEYVAVVKVDRLEGTLPCFQHPDRLVVRIDSACATGQGWQDRTCECADQLQMALEAIAEAGEGIIIHIPTQDGRGMGLPFKLATLWLQHELKLNTVEAARFLSNSDIIDNRTYGGVIGVLRYLGVPPGSGIVLATNNPEKEAIFAANGYCLRETIPVVAKPTDYTRPHLEAKQSYFGHRDLIVGLANS